MVSYEEALEIILRSVNRLGMTGIPLKDSLHRILSEDIYARTDMPPFDNSAMDGYAVVGDSIKGAKKEKPVVLRYIGDITTGGAGSIEVNPGDAARIGTGGKIPRGADTVVMVEDTDFKDGIVYVYSEQQVGKNIRLAGEDFKEGERGLDGGDVIRAGEISFLAANGITQVPVYERPRVGVLSTGSEIVAPEEGLTGSRIRDSNNPTICGLAEKYGAVPENLGIIPDDLKKLSSFIEREMARFDFFITFGGISKGHDDYIKNVFHNAGANMEFWTVAIRPGKPFGFGKFNDTLIFALPGNPVSAFVTFEVFCQPALKKAMGASPPYREYFKALLAEDFYKKEGFTFFTRGNLAGEFPDYRFIPFKKQGSGMISSMVNTDAIMVTPAGRDKIEAGEKVTVFRI